MDDVLPATAQHPQSPEFQPSPEFLARAKRMDDAMHLRKSDRIPVAPIVCTFYPTRINGISNKEAMHNRS